MHRTKVTVVEEALDANNTIASANRADFDRAAVTVVNFMSAPGAGKTTLLERVVATYRRAGRRARRRRAGLDGRRPPRDLHVPVTQLNTGAGFGGECHLDANMVRSAIPSLPLDEIDLLLDRERRQPRVPGRVPDRRGRAGDGHRGDRGRGQAAQVPADVPRLRARARQQDRPAAAPRLRPRPAALQHRPGPPGRRDDPRSARGPARASTPWREWLVRVAARGGAARARRLPAVAADAPAALLDERTEANARFFEADAERLARAVPPDGRALRSRRPADRVRPLAGRALGRTPRRGRVRPSGDRRQARAAGDRPCRRGAARAPSSGCSRARRHRDRLRRRRGRRGGRGRSRSPASAAA